MNIDDMQPGRELDAMVSEALGIPESEWDPPCFWGRHRTDDCSKDSTLGWDGWCYNCGMMVQEVKGEPRRYSTEPAAAWPLAEMLRERCPQISIIGSKGGWSVCAWEAKPPEGVSISIKIVPTIEHAICLAFLRAVAEKVACERN